MIPGEFITGSPEVTINAGYTVKTIKVKNTDGGFDISVTVKNVGNFAAKEIVQVYLKKPCKKLGNPSRALVAFSKTAELKPEESATLTMFVSDYALTSYDDSGITGYPFAYVTEGGEYVFYVGKNVRDAEKAFIYYQEKTQLFLQLTQAGAPQKEFDIICAEEGENGIVMNKKPVTTRKYSLRDRILNNLPEEIPFTGDKGIKLRDVKDGKNTLAEFVAQLTVDELDLLTRGDFHCKEDRKPYGGAGGFGGVTDELSEKGVPLTITCDGPAGVTLDYDSTLIPMATLLACTYNTELVEELYRAVAEELKERKVYINRSLKPEYPLMANAIYENDEIRMIVMVWGIPWERMTLSQANLLVVVSYLIQNAMLRANRYLDALREERYIKDSMILEPEAFESLVRAYVKARKKNLTQSTLLRIEDSDAYETTVISDELNTKLRQSDYLGMTKNGNIYVLLTNTNETEASIVIQRFLESGFRSHIVERLEG